jgi:hypothetical protein
MSRESRQVFDGQGILLHGFDYDNQAWVENGKYVRCGHPETTNCGCFGREHEGEPVRVSVETLDVFEDSSDRSHDTMEFSETPAGYVARERWAEKYDDLNGAPESDDDR